MPELKQYEQFENFCYMDELTVPSRARKPKGEKENDTRRITLVN